VYNSIWHALSYLSELCIHQSSGNGFQLRTSPSSGFPNCRRASARAILGELLPDYYFLKKKQSRLDLFVQSKKAVSSQPNSIKKIAEVRVMLRPMVSRSVEHPPGAYDHVFIALRQLRVGWCGASSMTRGRACSLRLLLGLERKIILGSVSSIIHYNILLLQIRDTSNLVGQVQVFISHRNRVVQL
jgi:hypothetical protein